MTKKEAVSILEGEIMRCRMAPKINGCQMTEEWQRTIDVCEIAIAAIREQEQRRWIPVDAVETVDAVEVVRCRDCKWYMPGDLFTDIMFCHRLKKDNGKPAKYYYCEDDFCSYGERKDGDGYGNCLVHPGSDLRGDPDGGGIVHHCQR